MTPEEKGRLEACTREIAEILYRNAEVKDVEQLKTPEGIEIAVREQMLENVSPNVGIFLSKKAVGQKQEFPEVTITETVEEMSLDGGKVRLRTAKGS
ncbi:MAG: hypothetical protein AUK48_14790 [Oscillatoriales cyanobacterium CG2_30_44_21]|nr:MAG: hypothetical protein AUK48_14790 [Oscillatoriales cyanobacterium CG2_30_44_21]